MFRAYRRAVIMLVSRLKAYGYKWKKWCIINAHTTKPNTIPLRHQDKEILEQLPTGDYYLHKKLWEEARLVKRFILQKRAADRVAPPLRNT